MIVKICTKFKFVTQTDRQTHTHTPDVMVEHKLVEGYSPGTAPAGAQGGDDVRSLREGACHHENLLQGIGVIDTIQDENGSGWQPGGWEDREGQSHATDRHINQPGGKWFTQELRVFMGKLMANDTI